MQVRDGMTRVVLTINPGHTLRAAACLMAERSVGAAVVIDPEQPGPGILTERDVLRRSPRARIPTPRRWPPPVLRADLRLAGMVARARR